MRRLRGGFWIFLVAVGLLSCSAATARPRATLGSAPPPPPPPPVSSPIPRLVLPPSPLTEDQQIVHVLNRLGYGPRPGDMERVKQMGLAAYIERQLDPASIPDTVVEEALRAYPTLTMSTAELVREYPRPKPEEATWR